MNSPHISNHINPTTSFSSVHPLSNTGVGVNEILERNTFNEIAKGSTISLRYNKGIPLIIRLGGKDNSDNSMSEFILISSEDYKLRYGYELATPYFIINTAKLPLREELQGYKGVRVDETIRLGLESDPNIASRLGLNKNIYISRYHMELRLLSSGEFILRDLGSTNGTFINYPNSSSMTEEHSPKRKNIERNMDEIAKNSFLLKLWPDLSTGMKQGPVGNCYFVAAINSIKEHPQGAELLGKMIQPHPQGYIVRFLGIDKFTIISDKDVADMGNRKLNGSLGDHILERAYWRLRHDRYDPSLRGGFNQQISSTSGTLLAVNHEGKHVHEGGWMKAVLSDFLGTLLVDIQETHNVFSSPNKGVLTHVKGDELVTASTPSVELLNVKTNSNPNWSSIFSFYFPSDSTIYKDAEQYLRRKGIAINQNNVHDRISQAIVSGTLTGDGITFFITDINNVKQKIYFNHAYSIGHIDHVSKYVELINPHDTIHERFYVSIENFCKFFNNVTIAKLR